MRYKANEIEKLADILNNDGVISVPTDTVYGLCARINSKEAYEKLARIKNRPNNKSFPVVCLNEEQIKNIAIVDAKVEKIIRTFMPGPITLVLKKKPETFSYINNAGSKISDELAVRIAPTKEIKELIEKTQSPLFLTSANTSGNKPCNNLDEIERDFPEIDGILEGDIFLNEASTILDCTNGSIKIQRTGPISIDEVMSVLEK